MCNEHPQYRKFAERQSDMFRLAERDHDLTLARLSALTGFHRNTLSGWKNGDHQMPTWAFAILCQHIPDDLTSLMLEPSGKAVSTPTDTACFDQLASAAIEYANRLVSARSPSSPGGTAIVPCEAVELTESKRRLGAKARAGE